MISFACTGCGKKLQVKEEFAGRKTKCPKCGAALSVPTLSTKPPIPEQKPTAPVTKVSHQTPPQVELDDPPPVQAPLQEFKECPFCGEKVLARAKKCKHCGSTLDGPVGEIAGARSGTVTTNITAATQVVMPHPLQGNGLAVTGLVFGILGFLFAFVPCIGWFGILPGILGTIFSGIGLAQVVRARQGKGVAVSGLVLSILAIIWWPLWTLVILGGLAGLGKRLEQETQKQPAGPPAVKPKKSEGPRAEVERQPDSQKKPERPRVEERARSGDAKSGGQRIPPAQPAEPEVDMTTPDGQIKYALKLYKQGVRARAVELMKGIVTSHPDSMAATEAKEILAPPTVGRRVFDSAPYYFEGTSPFGGGGHRGHDALSIRLIHAEIRPKDFSLVFDLRASPDYGDVFVWTTENRKPKNQFEHGWVALYVVDDNGAKIYADSPGFVGGQPEGFGGGNYPLKRIKFSPGEEVSLSVTFTMISEGATSVSFYSDKLDGWQSAWSWKSIRLKDSP